MRKLLYLLVLIMTISGCSTLSASKRFDITKKSGVEHVFNYPFKKVFYACEDALVLLTPAWPIIEESNFEEGYISADFIYCPLIVIVERIGEDKTLVKMQKFGLTYLNYQRYFKEVERLARRKE